MSQTHTNSTHLQTEKDSNTQLNGLQKKPTYTHINIMNRSGNSPSPTDDPLQTFTLTHVCQQYSTCAYVVKYAIKSITVDYVILEPGLKIFFLIIYFLSLYFHYIFCHMALRPSFTYNKF